MKFRPINIVQFLAIYLPIEDTLLLALRLPALLYAAARSLVELVMLVLLFLVVFQRANSGRNLKWTRLEIPMFLFVCGAVIAIFLNEASWFPALINMRSLLRYTILCFLIAQLSLSTTDVDRLLRWLVISALIQVGFSLMQVALPPLDSLLRTWRASVSVDVGGVIKTLSKQKTGNATGMFSEAAGAGMFLCIAITILAVHYTITLRLKMRRILMLGLFVLGVYLTYKRSTLVLGVVAAALIPIAFGRKKERLRFILGYAFISFLVIMVLLSGAGMFTSSEKIDVKALRGEGIDDVSGYVTEILTTEYWSTRFQASRGRVIFKVGEALIMEPQIFGYSPDLETAKKHIIKKNPFLVWLLEYTPLEDVYWIAIWLYYGVWGLLLWLLLMSRIFKFGRRLEKIGPTSSDVFLGRVMQVIIVLALLSALAERTFELRGFSFYLWVLTGITIARLRAARLCMPRAQDTEGHVLPYKV